MLDLPQATGIVRLDTTGLAEGRFELGLEWTEWGPMSQRLRAAPPARSAPAAGDDDGCRTLRRAQ